MEFVKEKIEAPVAPLRGPAGLEGVVIASCAFTESEGKKEPRPPLYVALRADNHLPAKAIWLAVDGGKVLLEDSPMEQAEIGARIWAEVGCFYAGFPKGPRYTGPVKAAWWSIIRKWWKP